MLNCKPPPCRLMFLSLAWNCSYYCCCELILLLPSCYASTRNVACFGLERKVHFFCGYQIDNLLVERCWRNGDWMLPIVDNFFPPNNYMNLRLYLFHLDFFAYTQLHIINKCWHNHKKNIIIILLLYYIYYLFSFRSSAFMKAKKICILNQIGKVKKTEYNEPK